MTHIFSKLALISGLVLTLSTAAIAADDVKLGKMTKAEFGALVDDYIMENPRIVVKAIEKYNKQQEEMQKKAFQDKLTALKDELDYPENPMAIGPYGADVTIVEFFDYNCGYCKKAFQDVMKLTENNKDVRVVFIEYPILSMASRDAARYAIAAAQQGSKAYFDYHAALMTYGGPKNKNTLEELAEKAGLDMTKLKEDIQSNVVMQEVMKNQKLARELGVRGTPAFLINDQFFPGYIPYTRIEKIIADLRANSAE